MVLDYKDTSPFTNVQCQHTSTFIVMNAATHILMYALKFWKICFVPKEMKTMYTICFKYPYSILLCYRALEVLDLFFNFIFNIRLEVSVPLITLQQNSELLLTFIVLTVLVLLSFFCNMDVGAKGLITKYRYVLVEGKYPLLNYIDNGHFIKKMP